MASLAKRLWEWLVAPRRPRAFYPDEEPMTRGERKRDQLGSAKHPVDDFPSADAIRQFPPQ